MGPSEHTSCAYQEISLLAELTSREWAHAGKPYKHGCCKKAIEILIDKQVLSKIIHEYDQLRKRNAFMGPYLKTKVFADGPQEFDDAREVVTDLISEYRAAESSDYISSRVD